MPAVSNANKAADALGTVLRAVQTAIAALLIEPDHERTLAHATAFLQAFGPIVVGWIWLCQAIFVEYSLGTELEETEKAFLIGRRRVARLCRIPG